MPESKDTIFWFEWAAAAENAEIEAENTRRQQEQERNGHGRSYGRR